MGGRFGRLLGAPFVQVRNWTTHTARPYRCSLLSVAQGLTGCQRRFAPMWAAGQGFRSNRADDSDLRIRFWPWVRHGRHTGAACRVVQIAARLGGRALGWVIWGLLWMNRCNNVPLPPALGNH